MPLNLFFQTFLLVLHGIILLAENKTADLFVLGSWFTLYFVIFVQKYLFKVLGILGDVNVKR